MVRIHSVAAPVLWNSLPEEFSVATLNHLFRIGKEKIAKAVHVM